MAHADISGREALQVTLIIAALACATSFVAIGLLLYLTGLT